MKSYFVAAALWLVPVLALPDDPAQIRIALPGPPTLAVIQPGVEVVVGLDDEVFHMKHQYWLRRDGDWYRARNHTDAFMYMENHHVPAALLHLAPGHYRHYHPTNGYDHGHGSWGGHNGRGHGCGGC
jgi:hypothetical protein